MASPPLGGQASDMYLKLAQLQALADRKGRVNNVYVRADSADDVAARGQADRGRVPRARRPPPARTSRSA